MASSLAMELQQAWIRSQLNKGSFSSVSSDSLSSPSFSPRNSDSSSSSSSPDLFSIPSSIYDSIGVADDSASYAEAFDNLDVSTILAHEQDGRFPQQQTFEEDVIMDPVLEYVNNMLMDEQMEDQCCMQQECLQYQAIVNGFYDILKEGDASNSLQETDYSSHGSTAADLESLQYGPETAGAGNEYQWGEVAAEYRWIDEVLVADPPSKPASPAVNPHLWPEEGMASALLSVGEDPLPKGRTIRSEGTVIEETVLNSRKKEETVLKKEVKPRYPWQQVQQAKPRELSATAQQMMAGFSSEVGEFVMNGTHSTYGAVVVVTEEQQTAKEDHFSFVRNGDLKAEEDAKLYKEWSSIPAAEKNGNGPKKKKYVGGAAAPVDNLYSVDIRGLLVSCAQAVAATDVRKANGMLEEIRRYSSRYGSAMQRMAHFFAEALVARLAGTGSRLYTRSNAKRASAAKMLKAYSLMFSVNPFVKVAHYFANHSILKAAEGAARLHIIDYGIFYGFQWPSLISALAERKGGPPFLRITGIDFPHPGADPAARVQETGHRLAEYARTYNVPFDYHAIAQQWEDVEPSALHLRPGEEILVVNCINRLRHLMDETVIAASPRKKVLSRMRSLNPNLLVTSFLNANHNAPFFVSRFREAVYYYSSKFDMVESTVDGDSPERETMEEECMGGSILNVVACEGTERVERPESYKQWQARIQRAGFHAQPLLAPVVSKSRALVKNFYHKDYGVHVDESNRWMFLGWKGRIHEALATWKPAPSSRHVA